MAIVRLTIIVPAEMSATLRQTVAGGEYASTTEGSLEWTRRRDFDP